MACRIGLGEKAERRVVVTEVLPVASVPWRTRLRQGAASGYPNVSIFQLMYDH
jgi:hypothetical protein